MDPDDDPVVGRPTELMFQFKDKSSRFDATNCFCTISISEDSVAQQRIIHSKISDQLHYTNTFPKKGIYTIKLKGEPIEENKFQNFEIEYQIRVDKEESGTKTTPNEKLTTDQKIPILVIIVAVVFVTIILSKSQTGINKKTLTLLLLFSLVNLSVLSSFKFLDCNQDSDTHHSTQSHHKHPCCLPLLPIQNPQVKIAEPVETKLIYKIASGSLYINHLRPTLRDKSPPTSTLT
jgi:hypothetical protein